MLLGRAGLTHPHSRIRSPVVFFDRATNRQPHVLLWPTRFQMAILLILHTERGATTIRVPAFGRQLVSGVYRKTNI